MDYFPDGYEPGSKDILCGRGKGNLKHEGNQYFMTVIRANLKRYTDAPKRIDKSLVVSLIVSSLTDEGYSFVRRDTKTNRWFHLSEPQIHEKTGHAIRDILKKNPNAGSGSNSNNNQSYSKQAMILQANEQPDVVASQILSTALKVSKLVEKSQIDFTALSSAATEPFPHFITEQQPPQAAMSSADTYKRSSREFRRSSMLRLFDELSPEEFMTDEGLVAASDHDQPLPIDTRVSQVLRTSEMIQVMDALSPSAAAAAPTSEDVAFEDLGYGNGRPGKKRSNGSSREFRRSELLQFLDFNEDDFKEEDEEESGLLEVQKQQQDGGGSTTGAAAAGTAKQRASSMQPLPIDARTSDTLKNLFKDQEDIFTNLQNVFGTLPEDDVDPDDMDEETEEKARRASSLLGELLKRQEGLFTELRKLDSEFHGDD